MVPYVSQMNHLFLFEQKITLNSQDISQYCVFEESTNFKIIDVTTEVIVHQRLQF